MEIFIQVNGRSLKSMMFHNSATDVDIKSEVIQDNDVLDAVGTRIIRHILVFHKKIANVIALPVNEMVTDFEITETGVSYNVSD